MVRSDRTTPLPAIRLPAIRLKPDSTYIILVMLIAGSALRLAAPREFDVLHVLMQESGRVFSRTELCERIWQRDHEYDTRTVEIFITRLRKKVDAGFPAALIHTQRLVGYTVRAPA